MLHYHHPMVDGAKFWIIWKRLKLLRKAGHLQLIQNSAPSIIMWRQCDIWIFCFWKSFSNPKLRRVAGLSFKNIKHCQTKFYILSSFTYTLIPYSSSPTSWQVTWPSRLCGNIVLKRGSFFICLIQSFLRVSLSSAVHNGVISFLKQHTVRAPS